MRRERACLLLVNLLLLLALALIQRSANGQSNPVQQMPQVLTHDPAYWWQLYEQEQARADGLAEWGRIAITGLEQSLQAANDTITSQNETIRQLTTRADQLQARADTAEARIAPLTKNAWRLEGKTAAGRLIRKARNGLAAVGGLVISAVTLKLIF